jgi:hypothetical protein
MKSCIELFDFVDCLGEIFFIASSKTSIIIKCSRSELELQKLFYAH